MTASCIARFELRSGGQKLGEWQTPLQARIWREVWVAQSALKRGENLAEADVIRERRDVIGGRISLESAPDRGTTVAVSVGSIPALKEG